MSLLNNSQKVLKDDVLLVNSATGSVGKVGINQTSMEFLLGAFIFKISPKNEDLLLKYYLYYWLLGSEDKLNRIVIQGMFPRIRKENLKRLKIWVPDLNRQERVVEILDRFSGVGILE